ncbi:MAG: DUF1592 domain-containing protein [Verrucomicrobiota bacterium]|nr:DUF1592 domain-containing protein [Verrucomicrobiota bacterium]
MCRNAFNCHRLVLLALLSFNFVTVEAVFWKSKNSKKSGQEIYKEMCAHCHGENGEGVADKYDESLYGDRSLPALTKYIDRTMPEDNPDKLDAKGAAKVAEYIYGAFYSPAARAKVAPPKVELSRLTVSQYQNAVADIFDSFKEKPSKLTEERGLRGEYFNARDFNREKKAFERIDGQILFSFGEGTPEPVVAEQGTNHLGEEAFAIRWKGSILVEESGDYEFRIKTENGARLYVNGHEEPLIDAWVSSGPNVREESGMIRLLGGRAYPFKVDFFTYKEKTASIIVEWKPPHKAWEPIPRAHLIPQQLPVTLVVTTSFPADDGSAGYERGTTISREWDQASTYAAIEVAGKITDQVDDLAGTKKEDTERKSKLIQFCHRFAERAFRRPLSDEQKKLFIEQHFENVNEPSGQDAAVKKVILLVLKSPRFLYPEIPDGNVDSYDVASRLSFGLWDTLPDKQLLEAAAKGQLQTASEIASQAERMLNNSRARVKVRAFFEHWLEMEEAEDLSKDPLSFPGFNEAVLADLRTSLELFLDEVVWSEKSDYRELLLADYVFLNNRLEKVYQAGHQQGNGEKLGESEKKADEFRKVRFPADQRTGVLTHPYLLSAFAYHKSSSPIHRGVFLTRNIVGRSLKPPPMAIQFMDGRFDPKMTMREKVTELTSPNACQGCHAVINPLGFSLEHFDAIGRYRTMENEKPVNATSDYTTPGGETIQLKGARDVAEHAAKSKEAQQGFVRQLFQHIVKQPAQAYGPETLRELRGEFEKEGFNIQKLLVKIVSLSASHGIKPDTSLAGGNQ